MLSGKNLTDMGLGGRWWRPPHIGAEGLLWSEV